MIHRVNDIKHCIESNLLLQFFDNTIKIENTWGWGVMLKAIIVDLLYFLLHCIGDIICIYNNTRQK